MSEVGKCFKIVEEDEELTVQWPELKPGFEFQILKTENKSYCTGVTIIRCLKTGKVLNVESPINKDLNDGVSWFWCFFNLNQDVGDILEEIDNPNFITLDYSKIYPKNGNIILNHFQGKEVSIKYALTCFASQEGCDSEEYDTMMAAASYIDWLEKQLEFSDKAF